VSADPAQGREDQSGGGRQQRWLGAAILLLLILTTTQVARTGNEWQLPSSGLRQLAGVSRNSLCAVTLVSGAVYYGTLAEIRDGYVRLADVYYVRSAAAPAGAPVQSSLINRSRNDWHGPDWMAIPTDKILLLENVGEKSRLASLIAQDRSNPAPPAP